VRRPFDSIARIPIVAISIQTFSERPRVTDRSRDWPNADRGAVMQSQLGPPSLSGSVPPGAFSGTRPKGYFRDRRVGSAFGAPRGAAADAQEIERRNGIEVTDPFVGDA